MITSLKVKNAKQNWANILKFILNLGGDSTHIEILIGIITFTIRHLWEMLEILEPGYFWF